MKYKIYKDEENYLTGFEHTGTEQDTFELTPTTMNLSYLNCYIVVDYSVEWDEEKYQRILEEEEKEKKKPTWQDKIESQTFYTAMMTDTLIEENE